MSVGRIGLIKSESVHLAGNWQGAQDFNSFKSISLKDDFQQRVDADYCEQEQTAAEGGELLSVHSCLLQRQNEFHK